MTSLFDELREAECDDEGAQLLASGSSQQHGEMDFQSMRKSIKSTNENLEESGYQSVLARSHQSMYGTGWLINDGASSDSNDDVRDEWDGTMTIGNEKVKIDELSDLLASRYAFLSGAKTGVGAPILTFPDAQSGISYTQYCKLIAYLMQIPAEDAHCGYVIVADRRTDKWASVRTLILHLSNYFPSQIRMMLLIKPEGVLQRAIEMGYRSTIENCKFHIVLCHSLGDLYQWLSRDLLTADIGGKLRYNHLEWVQHRMDIERMKSSAALIASSLDEFSRCVKETELPNDATTTKHVLNTQTMEKDAIKEDFRIAVRKGLSLLTSIRQVDTKPSAEQLSPTRLLNVTSIERMLVQLDETERSFDRFWQRHETRLHQCLQLRTFEDEFRKLQANFARHMVYLDEHREIGDCAQRAQELIDKHRSYMRQTEEDVLAAQSLRGRGLELIEGNDVELEGSLLPKCDELHRMSDGLAGCMQRRLHVLTRSKSMHQQIHMANDWCERGIELLIREPHSTSLVDWSRQQQHTLTEFMREGEALNLNPHEQLASADETSPSSGEQTPTADTSTLLNQVNARMDDIRRLCQHRQSQLEKTANRQRRPVVAVSPEKQPVAAATTPSSGKVRESPEKSAAGTPSDAEAGYMPWSETEESTTTDAQSTSSSQSPQKAESEAESANQDGEQPSTPPCTAGSAPSTSATCDYVIAELVQTEQAYVEQLRQIVDYYVEPFEQGAAASALPASVRPRASAILFGNIHKICEFHERIFLRDLELAAGQTCQSQCASAVARCFIDRQANFELYNQYCMNKPRSEQLRHEHAQPLAKFLQDCQSSAGHQLPLGAHLLKPVQRITKYQLLLKELHRHCAQQSRDEVAHALQVMLRRLEQLNSSMHHQHIHAYPGDLLSLGNLMLHGRVNVWTSKGASLKLAGKSRKQQQRHVFLFEKSIMFCKRRAPANSPHHGNTNGSSADATYDFKAELPVCSLSLNEHVKTQPQRFELYSSAKQEVYVVQALDPVSKHDWVTKLRSLLQHDSTTTTTTSSPRRPQSWAAGPSSSVETGGGGPDGVHPESRSNGRRMATSPSSLSMCAGQPASEDTLLMLDNTNNNGGSSGSDVITETSSSPTHQPDAMNNLSNDRVTSSSAASIVNQASPSKVLAQ